MKRVLVAMLAVVGILFATSCSKDDNEETILTLSTKSVTFTSNGGKKFVTVTSNEAWEAQAPNWIEVTKEEKKLVLKAGENKTFEERTGEVVVKAGNLEQKVKVSQQGMSGKATITPKKLDLESAAGSTVVKVEANMDTWTAATNAAWLKVTAKPESDELIVKYEKNTEKAERTAKITVTIGKTKEIILVKQAATVSYILPYLDFKKFTLEEINKFETARGSQANGEYKNGMMVYNTKSEVFPVSLYAIEGKYAPACQLSAQSLEVMQQHLEPVKAYLLANGFKKTKEELLFESETAKAIIFLDKDQGTGGIVFLSKIKKPTPPQNDADTFKKFPWIPELPWGSTVKEVQDYEKTNGGKLAKDFPKKKKDFDLYLYVYKGDGEKPVSCWYYIGHDDSDLVVPNLLLKDLTFKKVELAYTKVGEQYVLSKKFLALAKAEGFEYQGVNDKGSDFYKNESKNTLMWTSAGTFKDDETKTPYLFITLQRGDALKQKSSAATYSTDDSSYFVEHLFQREEVEVKPRTIILSDLLK